jgi:homocysteine S-methyltransferase
MPLEEKLGNQPIITAQIDAPPGLDYQTTLQQARRLLALGVDAIQVTDNPRARVRMSPIAFAHILQMETATEVVLHFTCRDRNLLGIQSELLGAAALGLRWVLALTGDPSSVGELPAATSVFDVNSTGLVRILHGLNQGATLSGTDIAYPTNFRIGASVNPAAPNLDLEIAKLQEKLDSHVSFIQTPPVFDLKLLEQFAQKVAPLNLPVLVSLMPLRDARHAEFLHHEVPGLRIPEWIRKRLNAAKPNDVLDESLQIAQELFLGMRQILRGVHLLAEDNFPAIERLLQTVTL